MFFFFFFQAEDGIRDADVTGVQTCALPISQRLEIRTPVHRRLLAHGIANLETLRLAGVPDGVYELIALRSEERRVGKECRSRWASYEEKKKDVSLVIMILLPCLAR